MDESFEELVTAVLAGSASEELRDVLGKELEASEERRAEYVAQVRMHLMLEDRLSKPVRIVKRNHAVTLSVTAACAAAVLGIIGTWMLVPGSTNKEEIVVEQTPSQEEWLAQLTPRDLKAYNENMAFGGKEYDTDYGFFKYEPGEFANPGAAVEIILADQQGTLLHPGDRVWRENLEIDKGTLRFKFMNGTVVTLSGKADLAITCPEMMQLKTGILLVDAGAERTIIRFENTDFIVRNAALGLLTNPKAGRMDEIGRAHV